MLLLKTKSHPTDPYDVLFRSEQADPIFVPVLEHRHVNLNIISRIISEERIGTGGAEYGGLIITSQRAVEALGVVLISLKGALSIHLSQNYPTTALPLSNPQIQIPFSLAQSHIQYT